jgi:ribonuclease Z
LSSRHDVDPKPLAEQAKAEFSGKLDVAYDGYVVEVPVRD